VLHALIQEPIDSTQGAKMGFFDSLGAGDILGPVIGGMFDNKQQKRDIRYQREFAQNAIQWRTDDAVAAGVHPLFAMGANTTSFQPSMGSGSAAGDAVRQISRNVANKELVNLQKDLIKEQIENSRYRRETDRANSQQEKNVDPTIVLPRINQAVQEINKGQVDPFVKKNPEQSLNVKSIMSKIRIGKQEVWLPIDEIDEFFENPLAIGAAVFAYHGNKNIDWPRLFRDYTGKKSLKQTMKENIRKHIPIRVRKKHLLKKYAKPAEFGAMP